MSKKKSIKSSHSDQQQSPVISFPVICPRSSDYKHQYRLSTILDDQIIFLSQLMTEENIRSFLTFFNSQISYRLNPPVAPKRGEATRTSERFSVYDPIFAKHLFIETGLNSMLEELNLMENEGRRLVGLNPNIRIYRYLPGTYFGPHYDDSVMDSKTGWKSAWTLLIYFTEGDFKGGQTSFEIRRGEHISPDIVSGNALIHRHGHDCLKHEGRAVERGVKWVLRSDIMYM